MNRLLLIPAILLASVCFGQQITLPYDTITGRINYKQITELNYTNKDKVFSSALRWLEKRYKPAIDTMILVDKDSGKIVLKATVTEALRLPGTNQESYLEHVVSFDAKDNKCRMQISDLHFKEYFPATEYSPAGYKDVPMEGIIVGLLKDKFCSVNTVAYKKYIIAEDISIKAIMESFDQYLIQNDKPAEDKTVNAAASE